jgi:hypothetical protein
MDPIDKPDKPLELQATQSKSTESKELKPEEAKAIDPGAQPATSKVSEAEDKSQAKVDTGPISPTTTILRQELQTSAVYAQQVKLVNQDLRTSFQFEDPESRFRVFSPEMTSELPISEEEVYAKQHIQEQELTDTLIERWKRHRVLCLYGEPNLGKSSTATCIAHYLRATEKSIDRPTLLVPALDARVRVDLQALCRKEKEFGRRIIIFRDFLSRGNRDLTDFLSRLDDKYLTALSSSLSDIQTFIVFTAADRTIFEDIRIVESVGIGFHLNAPSEQILRRVFEQTVAQSKTSANLTEDQILELQRFGRTAPRVINFAKDYAHQIGDHLSVPEAFRKIDDLDSWFLRELAEAPISWRFAFTLAFAQAIPSDDDGVPWTECIELLTHLTPNIVQITGESESQKIYSKESISEDHMVQNSRALIVRDSATGGDVVRFGDPTYPKRLWSIIRNHNRSILSACFPTLVELAGKKENARIAARSLRMLGRLAELDTAAYLWPLVEKWSEEKGFAFYAKIGLLFDAAFATEDALYIKNCENRALALAKSEEKGAALAAVAICKQAGARRLDFCLDILRQVAESNLTKPLEDTQRIEKLLIRIGRERMEEEHSSDTTMVLEMYSELLADLGRRIFAEQIPFLISIQFCLTSLFFETDFAQLVRGLHQWSIRNSSLAALLSLLYLQPGGIADDLCRDEGKYAPDDVVPNENPIIRFLVVRRDSVFAFADFLEDIYYGFQAFFPPSTSRHFREAYFVHLRRLIKTVVYVAPEGQEGLRNVIARLLRSINHDLRMICHQFLTNDELIKEDKRLTEFALSSLQHGLLSSPKPANPFTKTTKGR